MHRNPENTPPEPFDSMIDDAVGHIVQFEDPQRFFDWFQGRLAECPAPQGDLFAEPEQLKALATVLGRTLWNAVPLPGNAFRPRPLPTPGRNDPCPCGSGRKFKRCCASGPQPPPIDTRTLWPLVLDKVAPPRRLEAIASGSVPAEVLSGLADECLAADHPKKGLQYLEPLFEGTIRRCDEEYDYALNLLCNLYDDLGYKNKKAALLARITEQVKRSPLRSGAWQRLAAMRMDAGQPQEAWRAFQAAQQDDPKSLSLGMLEVQLLLGEGQSSRARERARFWIKQLRRQGLGDEEQVLSFLTAIARDPEQTMAELGMEIAGGAGKALAASLRTLTGRELPDYGVSPAPPAPPAHASQDPQAGLAQHLRQMGLPEDQIAPALAQLEAEMASLDEELVSDEFDPVEAGPATGYLTAPRHLQEIEVHWREIFPLGKPFSVGDEPFADDDAWVPHNEAKWMAFLDTHPEAFDSLDILDDLATAVIVHPQSEIPGWDEKLLAPLLRRARSIIDHALAQSGSPLQLMWAAPDNRPALRSLVRLVAMEERSGNVDTAGTLAQEILALNPVDNHGIRTLVMNHLLRTGENERALRLADQYPDDVHPDLPYGKVLALFRQHRLEEARNALRDAMRNLPRVVRFLTAKRVREPKLDPTGVTVGGDDQAWLYRRTMYDAWLSTPGALEWLKQAAKRVQ